jgi:hypothetical protein
MLLFDPIARSNSEPASYGEDSFSFLNRVDSRAWAEVRRVLEEWFSSYPAAHAVDLRARFRSPIPSQHWGAWWELYLYRLFTCLEFAVVVHPDTPERGTHPDFRLDRGGEAFFMEALAVSSGVVEEGRHGTREGWILDAVNQAKNANFFVGLDFEHVGMERPRLREVTNPIEQWLESLDPDEVTTAILEGGEPPELRLPIRDWELSVEAYPVNQEHRGDPDHRLLGRGPISGGWVNDIEVLQKGLRRKFRHYGDLEEPFVVAVLGISSFLEARDVEQALFGRHAVQFEIGRPDRSRWVRQRDGVRMGPKGPRGTAVSAVLSAANLHPWACTRELPRLWFNPWAKMPFEFELPLATARASDAGSLVYSDSTVTAHEILGLPTGWPGFESDRVGFG